MQNKYSKFWVIFAILFFILTSWALYSSNFQKSLNSDSKMASTSMGSEVANWKEYKDPEGYFSLQYPENWKITSYDDVGIYNDDVEKKNKKDIDLTGPEGEISIQWTDSYGGGCPDGYEKLQLKNVEVDVCHLQTDPNYEDKERWIGIFYQLKESNNVGLFINAFANQENEKNREVILKIFSTLQLNKK